MNSAAGAPRRAGAEPQGAARVLAGLSQPQKSLDCALFYDARGSALFEDITRQPEYYPTRTECRLLESRAQDIAYRLGPAETLVEFGSGSSRKTEILLAAGAFRAYVPIDVSGAALSAAIRRLKARFPALEISPLLADFTADLCLEGDGPKAGFFPGSTIGNARPHEAIALLQRLRGALGAQAKLLVGVDVKKDPARLEAAYNDAAGVTAAFNLNILARINRELGADFDTAAFRHAAFYNDAEGCIEMHLVSARRQSVRLCGRAFDFAPGETIHTESAYKYAPGEFVELARAAGLRSECVWLDEEALFSLHLLAG